MPAIEHVRNSIDNAEDTYRDVKHEVISKAVMGNFDTGKNKLSNIVNTLLFKLTVKTSARRNLIGDMRIREYDGKEVSSLRGLPIPGELFCVDWNVAYQPSLRNTLAFRNYFRLKEKLGENGLTLEFDEEVMRELERIPEDLRNVGIEQYVDSVLEDWRREVDNETQKVRGITGENNTMANSVDSFIS